MREKLKGKASAQMTPNVGYVPLTYENSFYNEKNTTSRKQFTSSVPPIFVNGEYSVFKYSNEEYHVVKDNVCISMMAGLSGAKMFIENELHI